MKKIITNGNGMKTNSFIAGSPPQMTVAAWKSLAELERQYIEQGCSHEFYQDFLNFFVHLTDSRSGYLALVIHDHGGKIKYIQCVSSFNLPIDLEKRFTIETKKIFTCQAQNFEDLVHQSCDCESIIFNKIKLNDLDIKNYLSIPIAPFP
jgi:hypothetical protein